MEAKRQEEYDADLYLRLSREDGDMRCGRMTVIPGSIMTVRDLYR